MVRWPCWWQQQRDSCSVLCLGWYRLFGHEPHGATHATEKLFSQSWFMVGSVSIARSILFSRCARLYLFAVSVCIILLGGCKMQEYLYIFFFFLKGHIWALGNCMNHLGMCLTVKSVRGREDKAVLCSCFLFFYLKGIPSGKASV